MKASKSHLNGKMRRAEPNIKDKMLKWCAFQERSQQEARIKLYSLGMKGEEAEEMIAGLISENFINEARFARSYAGGKFRMKGWGRNKIKAGLRKYKVPEMLIKEALEEIPEDDYLKQMLKLIAVKSRTIPDESPEKQFYLLQNHLMMKGYEGDLIHETLTKLKQTKGKYESGSEE